MTGGFFGCQVSGFRCRGTRVEGTEQEAPPHGDNREFLAISVSSVSFCKEGSMNGTIQTIHDESRWPPALAILFVLFLMATLPGHVEVMPVWVSYSGCARGYCTDGRRQAHWRE